ncbi:DUF4267 domain-containing protein [Streptosporangium sp. CA-135522]|uniref:DUF4267 domain-containing protein n=1 Tax=Streptosporangium sp. CA-135522 TaxID=3240072 RepID=UPI003D908275
MSLISVAYVLSALIGVGIIFVGLRFMFAPVASAEGFGVAAPAEGGSGAYFAVKGIRDIASGLIIFALLALGQHDALGWMMLAATVIPVGDAVIVLKWRGPRSLAYGMHGATAAVMAAIAACLLLA